MIRAGGVDAVLVTNNLSWQQATLRVVSRLRQTQTLSSRCNTKQALQPSSCKQPLRIDQRSLETARNTAEIVQTIAQLARPCAVQAQSRHASLLIPPKTWHQSDFHTVQPVCVRSLSYCSTPAVSRCKSTALAETDAEQADAPLQASALTSTTTLAQRVGQTGALTARLLEPYGKLVLRSQHSFSLVPSDEQRLSGSPAYVYQDVSLRVCIKMKLPKCCLCTAPYDEYRTVNVRTSELLYF